MKRAFKALWPIISGLYLSLGLLAPYLHSMGRDASLLYFLLGRTCHQMAERSWHIFGYQIGFCARCTGIHSGLFFTGLLLSIIPSITGHIPRMVSIALLLPLLIDALFGPLIPGWGSNYISTATGFLAGVGVTLAVYRAILYEKKK